MMKIPQYALNIIKELENNGFEAYFVGGCVRDFIMDIVPHDFDITTNALPEQIKEVFSRYKTIPTGEKHGTITVLSDGNAVEVTTYRIDKNYTDGRHPDNVEFSISLEEDLKRRDFTMNAMAMDINGNITDLFGGMADIKNGIIKAVGNAEKRFNEDALRILRALRFASRFGFTLDNETSCAVLNLRQSLNKISAERIRDEFVGIINGQYADEILRNYRDVISVFIPEITSCFEFQQHNRFHKYDVWEHILHAVKSAKSPLIRLVMFFHDIAKPDCFTMDSDGVGHFKGHAEKSAEKAGGIMKRLRFSNKEIHNVKTLVFHHRDKLLNKYSIKKKLSEIGKDGVLNLFKVQRADLMAKNDFCKDEIEILTACENEAKEIIKRNECTSIKELKINGNDLIELGISGGDIKKILDLLLEKVISEQIENEYNHLVLCARSIINTL